MISVSEEDIDDVPNPAVTVCQPIAWKWPGIIDLWVELDHQGKIYEFVQKDEKLSNEARYQITTGFELYQEGDAGYIPLSKLLDRNIQEPGSEYAYMLYYFAYHNHIANLTQKESRLFSYHIQTQLWNNILLSKEFSFNTLGWTGEQKLLLSEWESMNQEAEMMGLKKQSIC